MLAGDPALLPGTVISVRRLALELGCARNTLLAAMKILEQEGLVRARAQAGYELLPPRPPSRRTSTSAGTSVPSGSRSATPSRRLSRPH
ncbi:hypothetical protein SMD44_p10262 (plasmid) [Streptomyces alboflavus]|uniref:HTH gntR-type domain-containing protein n=1 Tax=Streptomyces alboflavus TaxID=67267 RepID=A0A291W554_9ACTN|nr:hypothetical protein SMD44_p10262 [Streptomyces alboflavus]